jgi:hypothetical protein
MIELVIHFNAFTRKLEGGYRMSNGKKVGKYILPAEILAIMAANPDIRCEPLKC